MKRSRIPRWSRSSVTAIAKLSNVVVSNTSERPCPGRSGATTYATSAKEDQMSRKEFAELGCPWMSTTAGWRLSPTVTNDRFVPPVNFRDDLEAGDDMDRS